MTEDALPKTIYHYTTYDGLLGILKEKALWATKIHYLNDASELSEPLDVAKSFLEQYALQLTTDVIENAEEKLEINTRMLEEIRYNERINICVASFCADGDLLSQWRAYGLPDAAFAIGFHRERLVESIGSQPFKLNRCAYYEPGDYRTEVRSAITGSIAEAHAAGEVPVNFVYDLIQKAATMKFKCFEEEKEWRIVSSEPLSFTDPAFGFRAAKSMVIPYYSVPLNPSSIVEIVIGPSAHSELTGEAVSGMAHRLGLKAILGKIRVSMIPYRSY